MYRLLDLRMTFRVFLAGCPCGAALPCTSSGHATSQAASSSGSCTEAFGKGSEGQRALHLAKDFELRSSHNCHAAGRSSGASIPSLSASMVLLPHHRATTCMAWSGGQSRCSPCVCAHAWMLHAILWINKTIPWSSSAGTGRYTRQYLHLRRLPLLVVC